ncbi:flagellar basal-body MS-ring/collar protein FliF [Syntrophomonas palmitatica]|uniref:flagellar basal-body MS-ring/collar protein FliF n=1 Tax=Syntrophomonas palmitatica TaxID=402877 RepID=UPI0006D1583B|nr:flagellar basal-body MS-ring/collar protein FliF [Syntrophomonas palmitatica]
MQTWLDKARQLGVWCKEKWLSLSLNQKVMFSGLVLILIVAAVFLMMRTGQDNTYEVLYAEMEQKDAAAVKEKLDEYKAEYKLQDNGDNGITILVPPEIKDSTRLKLAAENLPSGEAGFELFQQTNFGETETDKKVKYQRALQGELARTIQSLDKIKAAKVNLALSEPTLFSDKEEPPKASVVINTREGQKLTPTEVKAIINLVANSVERMDPDNVVIVDQDGNLVSEDQPALQANTSEIVRAQLAMKREFEKEKEEAIQSMLDKVLGKNNSVVRVNAELNFNDREQFDERYTHDPDGPFVVSEDIKKESGTDTKTQTANAPGTDTNIPQYQQAENNGGTSTYDKSEKVRNYNLNKTETVTQYALGDVKYDYLTVSVFVNNAGTKNANLGDSEQKKEETIRNIIATSCGLRENRKDETVRLEDNISVAFIDFYAEPLRQLNLRGL